MDLDALLPLDVVVYVLLCAAVFDAVSSGDAIHLGAGRTTPIARPAIEWFLFKLVAGSSARYDRDAPRPERSSSWSINYLSVPGCSPPSTHVKAAGLEYLSPYHGITVCVQAKSSIWDPRKNANGGRR
jgi:hypothetical protein